MRAVVAHAAKDLRIEERSEPALGPHDVSVRIALPAGREINVGHTPNDERLTDLDAAINDAFKRALRQLGDETEQMRGQTKRHAEKALNGEG